jgi:CheY-like chemotaxis protein
VAPRLLLVEDNAVNQKVARRMLERLGFLHIEVACTGAEAVVAVDRGSFDLVLMDCQMPEMDGFEATKRIRMLDGARARVPILAMTANAMRGDRERCLESGMDDYMSKPLTSDVLSATIERALDRRKAEVDPLPS